MSQRELTVLGSSAQTPTRERNHNGYLLRWDNEVLLFDPGEGTQRQLSFAGRSAAKITRICITHFHGDHCLGLPGILQRLSLDRAPGPVDVYFPRGGTEYFERLRYASVYNAVTDLRVQPCDPGVVAEGPPFTLTARALDHRVETLGWRLDEPDGIHLIPEALAARGISGPAVGALRRKGIAEIDGATVHLAEVSEPRPGQSFAFVMDTALCDAAFELAAGADLLVCEATYLEADAALAREYKHLTARQAGLIAAEAGARRLVLTHFSQRYGDASAFAREAGELFADVVVAEDLMHVAVPPRREQLQTSERQP